MSQENHDYSAHDLGQALENLSTLGQDLITQLSRVVLGQEAVITEASNSSARCLSSLGAAVRPIFLLTTVG